MQSSWLLVQYHPDVNKQPGAEDKFKEISNAYEVGFEFLFHGIDLKPYANQFDHC